MFLAVDTVGFIRHLPHGLVDAFRATLEEVSECDIIVQVIDVADPDVEQHLTVVEGILTELEAAEKPRILVLNKLDRVAGEPDPSVIAKFNQVRGRSADRMVAISALTGAGLSDLLNAISELTRGRPVAVQLLLPFADTAWIDYIRRFGHIVDLKHETDGIHITAEIDPERLGPLQRFCHLA